MGIGVRHDDGRMGGNDELGPLLDQVVDAGDDGELAAWGECSFGFVEEIESFAVEAVDHQGDEGFAVGLFVERTVTIRGTDA